VSAVASPPIDIPRAFARRHGVLVRGDLLDGRVRVALREGTDPLVLVEVRRHLAGSVEVEIADPVTFERYLAAHYAPADDMAADEGASPDAGGDGPASARSDEAAAARLVDGLVAEAARQGVGTVHLEPGDGGVVVAMRRRGVLGETLRLPPPVGRRLVARIKALAGLDMDQVRLPQDGRAGLATADGRVELRVSTLPSRTGERVVLRILDRDRADRALGVPGMAGHADAAYRAALAEPDGLILVAGSLGSGRAATLYAGLRRLNDGSRSILTVEDPVTAAMEGVGQMQVDATVGLSFAAGLRAVLRQDPDAVMIGDLRDRETAEMAVQAALAGHLLLAAVDAPDAVGAITRLRAMKVEPFLLASTLRAVIAQRLVRRLCRACRAPVQAGKSASALLGFDPGTVIHGPVGCVDCGQTGYHGRIGVFEAIRVDETVRRMIHDGGDESLIARHAFLNAPNLGAAARALVRAGEIGAEDAIRVSRRETALA
jgi:general secretion pathway protein E